MDAKQITHCFVLHIANNPVTVAMIPIKPTSIVTIYEAITEKDIKYFKRISLLLFYPFWLNKEDILLQRKRKKS